MNDEGLRNLLVPLWKELIKKIEIRMGKTFCLMLRQEREESSNSCPLRTKMWMRQEDFEKKTPLSKRNPSFQTCASPRNDEAKFYDNIGRQHDAEKKTNGVWNSYESWNRVAAVSGIMASKPRSFHLLPTEVAESLFSVKFWVKHPEGSSKGFQNGTNKRSWAVQQ